MNENNGKIYITISDKRSDGEAGGNQIISQPKEKKTNDDLTKNYAQHQFFHFIENQAKQFVDYSISNIGNFQGNFQEQREMQYSLGIVKMGIGIGTAFATGGPVAGLIAIAGTAINYGYQYYSGMVATNQQNYSIEQLKKLSGLSTLSNGSR